MNVLIIGLLLLGVTENPNGSGFACDASVEQYVAAAGHVDTGGQLAFILVAMPVGFLFLAWAIHMAYTMIDFRELSKKCKVKIKHYGDILSRQTSTIGQAAILSATTFPETWKGNMHEWRNKDFSLKGYRSFDRCCEINGYEISIYEYKKIAKLLEDYKVRKATQDREKVSQGLLDKIFREAQEKLQTEYAPVIFQAGQQKTPKDAIVS